MKRRIISIMLCILIVLPFLSFFSYATYTHLFPVNGGYVYAKYGYSSLYGPSFHYGIDIHSNGDDTIYAACNGYVAVATDPCPHWSWAEDHSSDCGHYSTFGNYIRINNDDGTFSYYGHLTQKSLLVSAGQRVSQGQPIAKMGSSGCSTGKHLHYEVRRSTSSQDTINTNTDGGSISYIYTGYSPEEPDISFGDNKNAARTGKNITFYYGGLTEATYVEICFEKNGTIVFSDDTTKSRYYSTSFQQEGRYYVYVKAKLYGKWYESKKLLVDITNPVFNTSITQAKVNQEIVFSYDHLTYANKVELCFQKNDKIYYRQDMTKTKTITNYFNNSGTYEVFVQANYSGTIIESQHITIVVSEEHQHVFSVRRIEPTCTTQGYTEHICECGEHYEDEFVPSPGHNYLSSVTTAPKCTESGIRTYTCSRCQDSYNETIKASGHSYVATVTKPTCAEKGYTTHTCSVCQDSYVDNYVNAEGHRYGAVVTPPTCKEKGYTTYTCSVCGDTYTGNEVKATGHNYTSVVTPPTCTEKGYTTYTCSSCGNSYKSNETNALGHNFDDWTIVRPSTETENGLKQRICKTCGAVESDIIPMTGVNHDAVCPSRNMTDVIKTAWYHEAVDYVIANGIFAGVSETSFAPNMAMTRAMLVTVLYRMEGTPAVTSANKFTDVKAGQWYTDAITWAAEKGIVAGMTPTTFNPNGNITREQMASILYRYAQYKGKDTSARANLTSYKDGNTVSNWAYESMSWANAEGLITGTDVGLEPKGNATRAQVASILMRYNQKYS